MDRYIIYYDSGTTNTRIYLLNSNLELLDSKKYPIGSKDSAVHGSNEILVNKLYELLLEILNKNNIEYNQVYEIYASGMITSKFGLKEIPHLTTPVSIKDFSNELERVFENRFFKKDVFLIPGVKTSKDRIEFTNMMRGEEMETIGVFSNIPKNLKNDKIAIIIPGSHTQIILVENNTILDIISNFTGELYHAILQDTILSPISKTDDFSLVDKALTLGLTNLKKFGFTRALYITQIMQTFNYKDSDYRLSYLQGIINGGVIQSLEKYCKSYWKDCKTAIVIGNVNIQNTFKILLQNSNYIKNTIFPNDNIPFALKGFKYLYRNIKNL